MLKRNPSLAPCVILTAAAIGLLLFLQPSCWAENEAKSGAAGKTSALLMGDGNPRLHGVSRKRHKRHVHIKRRDTNVTGRVSRVLPSTAILPEDKVGVQECDEYLAKYEACISGKVPARALPQFRASFAATVQQWRKIATTPSTRVALAQACKQATETAKSAMEAYGCKF